MSNADEEFKRNYTKILPWIIGIPVFFLIIFIGVTFYQLDTINKRIEEGQSQTVKEMINRMNAGDIMSESYKKFVTLAVLEEESLSERYRQGHYSLVSRSFKLYLGFFTGIIMVIVGSLFVLLKLREYMNADVTPGKDWKFTLVTNSPGIVFGIVGAILIYTSSTTNDKISVRDNGLYLTREYLVAPFFGSTTEQNTMNEWMKSQAGDTASQDQKDVHITPPPAEKSEAEKTTSKITIQHPPK